MSWTSGFFNSDNGDRLYNSDQLSSMFKGLISDGVYESVGNKLAVQPNNGMTVHINTGRGYFFDKWVDNDAPYLITLEDSDVTLNRYAMIGVKVDVNNSVRSAEPVVKYSDFASTPVKPTPERSENVHEYTLAYVYIKAGVSEITASVIEDTRSDIELCGWVTGLITQLDTKTLFEQYDAIFLEWFNGLGEYLDTDVETKLVNDMIQLKGREFKTTALLSADAWASSDDKYTLTVSVNGVTADSDVLIAPSDETNYMKYGVRCTGQGLRNLTFTADNTPTVDIMLTVLAFNVDTVTDVTIESVSTFAVTDDGDGNVTISN